MLVIRRAVACALCLMFVVVPVALADTVEAPPADGPVSAPQPPHHHQDLISARRAAFHQYLQARRAAHRLGIHLDRPRAIHDAHTIGRLHRLGRGWHHRAAHYRHVWQVRGRAILAARYAYRERGVPYRWGGASPRGFDCSGLVRWAYLRVGINLPHYTGGLIHRGHRVHGPLRAGDLVFAEGGNHVGIYVGDGRMVDAPHAGAVVRSGPLNGWWTRSSARRIVG